MITNLRARLLGAFALVLLLVVVEIAIAYQQDVNSYPPQLAALGALTSDNPPQVARWKNIAAAAEQLRTNVTEPGIALRRQVSAGSASPGALAGFDHSGAAEQGFSGINSTLNQAIATERDLLTQRANAADRASSDLLNILIWGTLLTVALGVAIAILMATRFGQAMAQFAGVAQSIAAGNLSQRIRLTRRDEIGHAAAAFNGMADALEKDRAERIRAQAHAEFFAAPLPTGRLTVPVRRLFDRGRTA